VSLKELLVDGLWIVFFIGISGAGVMFGRQSGFGDTERYFWLPADLIVAALLLSGQREFIILIRKNAIFISWAALACLSSLWSLTPGLSLYYGIQLFFTIMVGFMLLINRDLQRILQIIFVAFLVCAILSIAAVAFRLGTPISLGGDWLGVFAHKNVLGSLMVIAMLSGICLLLEGWRPLFTMAGIVVATALLVLSRSGTSLTSTVVVLAILPLAIGYRKGPGTFVVCVGIVIAALAAGLLMFEVMDRDAVQSVLAALGKDQTLTGRTVLWDLGIEAYESRPWLGFGFRGYWEGAGTTAQYLRYLVDQPLWFFHNNFIEVAVAFGFIGPILLAAGFVVGLFLVVRAYAVDPQPVKIWPILMVAHVFVFCFAENPLFSNHSPYQLLFIVAVGSVFQGDVVRRRWSQ
jgi:O-antigen ligase